jgi:hypothetical protein
MGSWGAIIMSFFGAFFASLTLYWQFGILDATLLIPFMGFAMIGVAAICVLRNPGKGITASGKAERAIMWSSTAEGIGLFLASNIVINLHRAELLLPAMALVVGAHFIPIARAAAFPPFYALGAALITAALIGFVVPAPLGGAISGLMAAAGLWTASVIAVRRDQKYKKGQRDDLGFGLGPA